MIFSLSLYHGRKLASFAHFRGYYDALLDLFAEVGRVDLVHLDGVRLFKDMLDLIRAHYMKLDGQFATLLTNMLVLEGMAKTLYP